ncbi:hypothetical protein TNCV_307741 [Trichonephila clavipes]|nr:hypothetical protein TNCV_307741 [Trichonephila clavipes]
MTSETVEVARIALRPFWKSNVRLWIAQCDHAFTFSGISSDDTKYSALVVNLDAETLSYLGDEKPSHLLRKMKELSNGQLQDDFLQSLWLQRMPSHIQTVLSASSEPLDKLAIIADKVSEVVGASSTICAATTVPPPSQSSSCSVQPTMDSLVSLWNKELNLGLRRPFIWTFIIADVSSPIIGADFLKHFNLLIDLKKKRPSKSPWSSPLHVVPKSDSTVRPVGDYRQLNSVTEFDSYPMPYLNDFAHALHGKRIFSKIDIFKAFHQIPIAECDIPKTAVTTPWGLYEYTHLCFGLVNAPQTFMRFMHEVLRGLPFCFVYLDDILCYSENAEEHRSHLRTIFQRLSSYGLKLNISKCVFGVTELIFLGHFITPDGIKPLPDKVQAVLDYKQPETRCKQALADAALLAHPSPSAPLALHVDASDYAIGGALHQVVDSELQPLAFFSRKLISSEKVLQCLRP